MLCRTSFEVFVDTLGCFWVGSSSRTCGWVESIEDLIDKLFGLCDSLVDEMLLDFSEAVLDPLELLI